MKNSHSRIRKVRFHLNDGNKNDDRLKERHVPVVDSSNLVSQMLARYQEKTAPEDTFYDNFTTWYLDWQAFSGPVIKALESGTYASRRRRPDEDLSRVWEKTLITHRPRLENLQHHLNEMKGSYRKRLGVSFSDENQKHCSDSEDLVSASTSPAREVVEE
jgi:hypothetical protein